MENKQSENIIWRAARTETDEFRLTTRYFQDQLAADIRIWFYSEENRRFYPTSKGVRIPPGLLSELHRALGNLLNELPSGQKAPNPAPPGQGTTLQGKEHTVK